MRACARDRVGISIRVERIYRKSASGSRLERKKKNGYIRSLLYRDDRGVCSKRFSTGLACRRIYYTYCARVYAHMYIKQSANCAVPGSRRKNIKNRLCRRRRWRRPKVYFISMRVLLSAFLLRRYHEEVELRKVTAVQSEFRPDKKLIRAQCSGAGPAMQVHGDRRW